MKEWWTKILNLIAKFVFFIKKNFLEQISFFCEIIS